jgi:amino acid transporter
MSTGETTSMSANSTQPTTESAPELDGRLGTWGIVFSVIAWAAPLLVVVGLMPSVIGFAGYGIVAGFVVTTVVLLLFSVGYTTVTRYVENPGAFYAYVTAGLGKAAGLGGAFIATVGYTLLLLTTWIAFGVYFRALIHDTLGGPDISWWVYGLLGAAVAGGFAYRRIEFSAKALTVALMLEVVLVVVFDTVVFAKGGAGGVATEPFTWTGVTSGSFGLAMLYAALCFIGFESSAIYREEAKNPNVTVPRATYVAVISIGVFYCISAWALVTALGPEGVATAGDGNVTTMFGDLGARYVSNIVPDIVNVLVVTSTFACLLATHNAVARYGYSMGKDGVLPRRLGRAHPRFQSPYVVSTLLTAVELVIVLVIAAATRFKGDGTDAFTVYVRTNGLGTIAVVFLMCLVSVAVIVYFRQHPERAGLGLWRTLVAPGLGLVGLVLILVLGLMNADMLIGASATVSTLLALTLPCVFMAGLLYARWLRNHNEDVYAKIGRQ